jgi:hypothetical protein
MRDKRGKAIVEAELQHISAGQPLLSVPQIFPLGQQPEPSAHAYSPTSQLLPEQQLVASQPLVPDQGSFFTLPTPSKAIRITVIFILLVCMQQRYLWWKTKK